MGSLKMQVDHPVRVLYLFAGGFWAECPAANNAADASIRLPLRLLGWPPSLLYDHFPGLTVLEAGPYVGMALISKLFSVGW